MGCCLRYRRATFFLKLISCVWMFCLCVCLCTTTCLVPRGQKEAWTTWDYSHRQQPDTAWMLGTDPGSSRRANSALTTEPSLRPGHSVSVSVPRASKGRARVCRQQPKPRAQAQPCLSLPLEALASALSDSLPNDGWTAAGLSPHSGARHTHPTTGLDHWGL